eukprot:4503683-Amphidinium_carterae.1
MWKRQNMKQMHSLVLFLGRHQHYQPCVVIFIDFSTPDRYRGRSGYYQVLWYPERLGNKVSRMLRPRSTWAQ